MHDLRYFACMQGVFSCLPVPEYAMYAVVHQRDDHCHSPSATRCCCCCRCLHEAAAATARSSLFRRKHGKRDKKMLLSLQSMFLVQGARLTATYVLHKNRTRLRQNQSGSQMLLQMSVVIVPRVLQLETRWNVHTSAVPDARNSERRVRLPRATATSSSSVCQW